MRVSSSDVLDVPFVRSQIRSLLVVDSVRANSRGKFEQKTRHYALMKF